MIPATLIYEAVSLTMGLIKLARESKALSLKQLQDIKKQLNEEFENYPDWKDLKHE